MEKEPRKASEVILELEAKLNKLIGLVTSQDQLIKVLSNKVNNLISKLDNPVVQPKITVEAVNSNPFTMVPEQIPEKNIPISSENTIQIENKPVGFRRTSRPETYSGDNSYLPKIANSVEENKFPIQIPKASGKAEIIVNSKKQEQQSQQSLQNKPKITSTSTIPVTQRVVGANGKPAFLADVEVLDGNMQSVFKTRTNGIGKWTAPLSIGSYRVIIRKREPLTKEQIEIAQDIQVDGSNSPLELPLVVIKK